MLYNSLYFLVALLLGVLPFFQLISFYSKLTAGLVFLISCNLFLITLQSFNLKNIISKINLIDIVISLFLISSVVSTLISPFMTASITGLLKYIFYYILYITFRVLITRSNKYIYYLLGAVSLGLIIIVIEGIIQLIFGTSSLATWQDPRLLASQKINRIYSLFFNPNLFACYLLLFSGIFSIVSITSFLVKKYKTCIISSIVLIISIILILQTGSRGAWIGLGVQGLVSFIYLSFNISRLNLLLIISGIFSGGLVFFAYKPAFLHRLLSIFTVHGDSSNSFRMHVWSHCYNIFTDNWLWGIGIGSKAFYLAYGAYMSFSRYTALGAYSVPLELAVENGIWGLLLYIILVLSVIYYTSKYIIQISRNILDIKLNNIIALGVGVSLLGIIAMSLFDIVAMRIQIIVFILLWLVILKNK